MSKDNPSGIRQYFSEEIVSNADGTTSVRRAFTDHFGDDFDLYICRALEPWQCEEPPEDPEVLEHLLAHEAEVDEMCDDDVESHEHLEDIADDGTVYVGVMADDDDEEVADDYPA